MAPGAPSTPPPLARWVNPQPTSLSCCGAKRMDRKTTNYIWGAIYGGTITFVLGLFLLVLLEPFVNEWHWIAFFAISTWAAHLGGREGQKCR